MGSLGTSSGCRRQVFDAHAVNPRPDFDSLSDDARLVYALHGSRLVHVSEVARGLDCDCHCPHCCTPLVARRGEIRVAHFAHRGGQACYWARETAIHLLAKEIIGGHSSLELPAVHSRYHDRVLAGSRRLRYSNVRIEKRFHDIIPDIIVTGEGVDFIIEVFVTNKVRLAKAAKIRQQQTHAIEVDVRDLRHVLDRREVTKQIIGETTNKAWLYAPEFETDLPPPPEPVFQPPPPKIAAAEPAESAESLALSAKRRAELAAAYKPPTPYNVPRRLSDVRRAMMMGQIPAKCKSCGAQTTNWATIDCETGICVCRSCVINAAAVRKGSL